MQMSDPAGTITFNKEESGFLNKAYDVVGQLSFRASQANFGMSVQHQEQQYAFREIVGCLQNSDILPGVFIGMSAMAVCGNSIRELGNGKGSPEIESFMIDAIRNNFDDDICEDVQAWMYGCRQAKNYKALENSVPYAKLGALTYIICNLDLLKKLADEPANVESLSKLAAGYKITGHSCKGMFPALDTLYEEKLERFQASLNTAVPNRPQPKPMQP